MKLEIRQELRETGTALPYPDKLSKLHPTRFHSTIQEL